MIKEEDNLGLLLLGDRSNKFYQERLKDCSLKTIATHFDTINQHLPNDFIYLEPILEKLLCVAKNKHVRSLIIPNITLHETLDRLIRKNIEATSINIIHPLHCSLQAFKKHNIKQFFLLGSAYTSHCQWIKHYFTQNKITVLSIPEKHTKEIDEIRKRTYESKETENDHNRYFQLLKHYQTLAPVLIACTELSLLCSKEFIDQKNIEESHLLLDMATLQIEWAIKNNTK